MEEFFRGVHGLESVLDENTANYGDDNELCHDIPLHHANSTFCPWNHIQEGRFNAVASVRMISSLLGLMGACSIIILALIKKRVCNLEVHPIFMLSVADCILSLLWIFGSALWLADVSDEDYERSFCYIVTVLTGIAECVTINLSLVYGIFAYTRMKKTKVHTILMNRTQTKISRKFIVLVYCVSWVLPAVVILLAFGITDSYFNFLRFAQRCTCRCRPTVINILPFPNMNYNNDTREFMRRQLTVTAALSATISLQYISVFILLVIFYLKTLRRIRILKKEIETQDDVTNYGAITMISWGQSQARKRVVLFLTAFIVTGFFNLCCEVFLLPVTFSIWNGNKIFGFQEIYFTFIFAQSLTLPLQGFVNAIVYGWTRDDFMNIMAHPQYFGSQGFSNSGGLEQTFSDNYESQEDILSHNSLDIQ